MRSGSGIVTSFPHPRMDTKSTAPLGARTDHPDREMHLAAELHESAYEMPSAAITARLGRPAIAPTVTGPSSARFSFSTGPSNTGSTPVRAVWIAVSTAPTDSMSNRPRIALSRSRSNAPWRLQSGSACRPSTIHQSRGAEPGDRLCVGRTSILRTRAAALQSARNAFPDGSRATAFVVQPPPAARSEWRRSGRPGPRLSRSRPGRPPSRSRCPVGRALSLANSGSRVGIAARPCAGAGGGVSQWQSVLVARLSVRDTRALHVRRCWCVGARSSLAGPAPLAQVVVL